MSVLISIITPVCNTEEYLAQCLKSVTEQSVTDWEWILVDDGSTDGSLAVLEEYARRDARLRVFSQKNQGPAAARNLALDHVRGDYIVGLDSDDWMEPETLRKIRDVIDEYGPDMILWDFKRCRDGRFIPGRYPMPEAGYHDHESTMKYAADFIFRPEAQKEQYFPSLSTRAIRSDVIRNRHLRFDPSLKRTEDYMFLAEVHSHLKDMYVIREQIAVYRMHASSITHGYTEGYMDMIDRIRDSVLRLDVGLGRDEMVRRAAGMYVYRTFVALEQEVRCGKRLCARLRGIRRILRRDRVKRCAAELSGEGRTLFGRRFLILRSGSAILTDLVLRRRRNG